MADSTPETPLEALLKLPAAVVTELGAALPRLAERTKAQVDFAATLLEKLRCGDLGSRLSSLAPQVPERLADVVPFEPRGTRPTPASPEPIEVIEVTTVPSKRTATKKATASKRPVAKRPAKATTPTVAPITAASGSTAPEASALAIPGYDALAASQVVPRLESLSGPDLELVRRYELAGRGRRTILSRIAQLQAG